MYISAFIHILINIHTHGLQVTNRLSVFKHKENFFSNTGSGVHAFMLEVTLSTQDAMMVCLKAGSDITK